MLLLTQQNTHISKTQFRFQGVTYSSHLEYVRAGLANDRPCLIIRQQY